jgi:pyruvate dehydrogenase E2 component (dihydrolipoamide acetyltransferase)
MPTEVVLPRVDMDMAEGRISRWYVEEGASVAKGQPIFEIETDKAAMEVEAPAAGTIRGLSNALDTAIPVGSVVAWIDAEGEGAGVTSPRLRGEVDGAPRPPSEGAEQGRNRNRGETAGEGLSEFKPALAASHPAPHRPSAELGPPLPASGERKFPPSAQPELRATPLARRLARDHGLDLGALRGSGPKGRIQAADVEARAADVAPAAPAAIGKQGALHRQWLRQGEGTPLVLLHGFGGDLNAWRLLLATARTKGSVLGIDLPGHGGSADRHIAGFSDMVEAVAETLGQERLGAIHLAGHSLGGAVAAALAAREGIEARSLFLIAPAGLGPDMNGAFVSGFLRAGSKASLAPWISELVSDPAALGPAFVEATLRQRREAGIDKALATVASTLFPDGTQAFSVRYAFERLSLPVKIVWGAEDRIIPARHAQGLPGRIAIHLFRGLGHMPHFEAREDVAALWREVLRAAGE